MFCHPSPVVSPVNGSTNRPASRSMQPLPPRLQTDEKLGFEAAVAALGKSWVIAGQRLSQGENMLHIFGLA